MIDALQYVHSIFLFGFLFGFLFAAGAYGFIFLTTLLIREKPKENPVDQLKQRNELLELQNEVLKEIREAIYHTKQN